MTVHFREESNAVVEILPSLSLLRIMLIFDTESHILALLKLFFIYSLFFFSLFREPTWAKRALDSSHRPVTHSQACLLRAALRDTNFFGSALSFLLALYLFSGWTGKTWSSLLVRTSCCFVLRKRNGKQQTRTAVALRHTDTQTHVHGGHLGAPIRTSGLSSAHSNLACAAEHAQKGHPAMWTRGVAVGEFVCRASEWTEDMCAHVHLFRQLFMGEPYVQVFLIRDETVC